MGVFPLQALTSLGHECQDLLSPCDGMHVYTDKTSVYTLIRKTFGGNEGPMLTPREKSTPPEKKNNPRRCIKQDSKPNTQPTCYSGPCSLLPKPVIPYPTPEHKITHSCALEESVVTCGRTLKAKSTLRTTDELWSGGGPQRLTPE